MDLRNVRRHVYVQYTCLYVLVYGCRLVQCAHTISSLPSHHPSHLPSLPATHCISQYNRSCKFNLQPASLGFSNFCLDQKQSPYEMFESDINSTFCQWNILWLKRKPGKPPTPTHSLSRLRRFLLDNIRPLWIRDTLIAILLSAEHEEVEK